jgi:hypothetical protein
MIATIDYTSIITQAWYSYNPRRIITKIQDVSANVSTNRVFKITFDDSSFIMAKVSNFGKYENFKEDHNIINVMANNLEYPYDLFLSSSLMKNDELFLYKYEDKCIEVWMVFYRVVRIKNKLPKRLDESQIKILGSELAKFHKVCDTMTPVLPKSSKNLQKDIHSLLRRLDKEGNETKFQGYNSLIKHHCELFLQNAETLSFESFPMIPVFVDWNIGNFSVRDNGTFFSRWDYDWFRMSSRILDFYSFSRVVSDIGDKTDFSYTSTQLSEERFILFLQEYHKVFPLCENEIRFMKEAYRFFILNYVINNGKYFFTAEYAKKLQREAYEIHLPQLDTLFNPEVILKALGI